jgi:aldehyde dehydrogenase (NAD+)
MQATLPITRLKNTTLQSDPISISDRKKSLNALYTLVKENETAIEGALKQDLNKSDAEAYITEILFCYNEIKHALRHLDQWAARKRVTTPLFFFPAKSYIQPEPLGVALIISPWNYPFQLLISPLVGALAAGNRVVLKPSEMAPATEQLVASLIPQYFHEDLVSVICGGPEITKQLIDEKPDLIFFTGSTATGSKIMEYASRHLIPVILELGGKSPCIVDESTDIAVAARRIAWGKFINAGQTCIAPDYVLVHNKIQEKFMEFLYKEMDLMFPQEPDRYCKIINNRHFDRISKMLQGPIVKGGKTDAQHLRIEPTILLNPDPSHPAMQEEIFGPVLPVFTFNDFHQVIYTLQGKEKPLAFYLFSENKEHIELANRRISAGGFCINDTILHIANGHLPFGGVGQSGFGAYHGKYSFDAFTHFKPVLHKSTSLDLKLRYPPFHQIIKKMENIVLRISS